MGHQPTAGHTDTLFRHIGNLAMPIKFSMFLDCGGKLEYPEKNHNDTERT